MHAWNGIVSDDEIRRYDAAGFGRSGGVGKRACLLIIDVQYRTVGTVRKPYWQAIEEYPTACGEDGWRAVDHLQPLLAAFRKLGLPVLYPHVAPKNVETDRGRLTAKVPSIMTIDEQGYRFVEEVAPGPGNVLLPKKHPSAFFGTPLVSHLIDLGVDTLYATGCTTSGCIRSSVTDAFAYNFNVVIPEECVYDRSPTSHAVNLFDMNAKYADVVSTREAIAMLSMMGNKDAEA